MDHWRRKPQANEGDYRGVAAPNSHVTQSDEAQYADVIDALAITMVKDVTRKYKK
jgi:hypothetical protein